MLPRSSANSRQALISSRLAEDEYKPAKTTREAWVIIKKEVLPVAGARAFRTFPILATIIAAGMVHDQDFKEALPIAESSRYLFVGTSVGLVNGLATFISAEFGELTRLAAELSKILEDSSARGTLLTKIQQHVINIENLVSAGQAVSAGLSAVSITALLLEEPFLLACNLDAGVAHQIGHFNRGFCLTIPSGLLAIVYMQYFIGIKNIKIPARVSALQHVATAALILALTGPANFKMYGIGGSLTATTVSLATFLYYFRRRHRAAMLAEYGVRLPKLTYSELYQKAKKLLWNSWPFALEVTVDWSTLLATSLFLLDADRQSLRGFYGATLLSPLILNTVMAYAMAYRGILSRRIASAKKSLLITREGEALDVSINRRKVEYLARMDEVECLAREGRRGAMVFTMLSSGLFCGIARPVNNLVVGVGPIKHSMTQMAMLTVNFDAGRLMNANTLQAFTDRRSLRYPAMLSFKSIYSGLIVGALLFYFAGGIKGLWFYVVSSFVMLFCHIKLFHEANRQIAHVRQNPVELLSEEERKQVPQVLHTLVDGRQDELCRESTSWIAMPNRPSMRNAVRNLTRVGVAWLRKPRIPQARQANLLGEERSVELGRK